jgi:hypothetical protein
MVILIVAKTTKAAEYNLSDDTCAKLLAGLSERKFDHTSPDLLRANVPTFSTFIPTS